MEKIDKILFGDNQFFGINHMSQDKAQQLAEQFHDINNIFSIYDIAIESGIQGIMLNSNDRAKDICNFFKKNPNKYGHINWYPSIPYPHKYANMIAEKGIVPTINDVLFKNNTALGVFNMLTKGSTALLGKDFIKIMQLLIDIEMQIFSGLNIKVIFLQNVITDLILGFGIKEIFIEYSEYIKNKYKATPGFITQNMPYLKSKLEEWEISEIAICTSFNKIGYLMSPDVQSYIDATLNNSPDKYQIMAMSTLASGAIPAKDAYSFINSTKIQSVVFGASSRKNIQETISLIKI